MFSSSMAPKDEEPLQAVVVADVFTENFAPLLADTPFALLPLVGVPFIDYTLESLALSGVNETFLFCCSHADRIKAYIQKSEEERVSWSARMTVHVVVSEKCQSLGDALRDLDAKGLINGYFVLVGADTISNVKLLPLMEKHKEICKRDKGAAMTLLYKTAVPGHRAHTAGEDFLISADADTYQVLSHQKLPKDSRQKVIFPMEHFIEHSDVEIHNDLIDTNIAICSPSVLPLFAENFDFQSRDDFIKGILMNEEILASRIYWYKLRGDQYATRVINWQMYQIVSQDVMHRWVYPLVPEFGISKHQHNFMLLRNHVYRHRDVTLAKLCSLEEFVTVSSGCSVGENTKITRSVIGKNCTVGQNCTVSDSFIMDGCTIGNNCKIVASVVSFDCKLKNHVDISSVILGSGVHLNEKTSLKDSLVQKGPSSSSSQKIGNKAYVFEQQQSANDAESVDSDVSDAKLPEVPLPTAVSAWRDDKSEPYSSSSEEEMSRSASPVQEDANLFFQEVVDSLARGYEQKMKCDYLVLEINSSRYAYNMSLQEVNFYVVQSLFNMPAMATTTNILATFKDLLKYFSPIISNYIKGAGAMMDCLNAIEDCCDKNETLAARVGQVLHLLYDRDVVTEEVIVEWYGGVVKEQRSLCKNAQLQKFIDWLKEASEESNEEDSE